MRAAKRLRLLCVFPDRSGKMALAAAGRAGDEHIQAVRGIGNGRHGDPQLIFQAAVRADKAGERPVLSGLLLCLRWLLLHGRLRPDVRRLLRCWEQPAPSRPENPVSAPLPGQIVTHGLCACTDLPSAEIMYPAYGSKKLLILTTAALADSSSRATSSLPFMASRMVIASSRTGRFMPHRPGNSSPPLFIII